MDLPPSDLLNSSCENTSQLFPIAMAFQPIVDVAERTTYAHEALVRGPLGQTAAEVFRDTPPEDLDQLDQYCRVAAIREAAGLGLDTRLHLNFLPNSLEDPESYISAILEAADGAAIPHSSITFEIVEGEKITDVEKVKEIFAYYRRLGFLTALDDFGEGSSGLNLLSEIRPDIVKLDLRLIHDIDSDSVRETIVESISGMCRDLGTILIAEGIETAEESWLLLDHGINLQQGFLFARPAFRQLANPFFPPTRESEPARETLFRRT
jgi:EAL domain-containing protein (putative c-di-GMP-specific phosphodiesterase class I)